MIAETEKRKTLEGKVKITKRLINNKTKEKFKAIFNKFTSLYGKIFEKFVFTVKPKTLKKSVDNKRNSKIFKNGAKDICKFLKSKTCEYEISYKNYPKLFESIKQRAKLQYCLKMILHYKDNIKKFDKL